jgi:hypothetical protein
VLPLLWMSNRFLAITKYLIWEFPTDPWPIMTRQSKSSHSMMGRGATWSDPGHDNTALSWLIDIISTIDFNILTCIDAIDNGLVNFLIRCFCQARQLGWEELWYSFCSLPAVPPSQSIHQAHPQAAFLQKQLDLPRPVNHGEGKKLGWKAQLLE